jgi:hypothetical protein
MLKATTTILALLAVVCFDSEILSQEPPQTPQVKPQQQPERSIKGQQEPAGQPNHAGAVPPTIPNSHSPATSNEPQPNAQYGGEEGTEFWAPLFGHGLKITDTLLVAVTFLLFGATIALWWSTRRLVKGAEDTAERQLRAYVDISEVACAIVPIEGSQTGQVNAASTVTIKNFGATPANSVISTPRTIIREYPLGSVALPPPTRPPIEARLAPGAHRTFGCPTEEGIVTPVQLADWDKGVVAIYTYGTITYDDEFRNNWIIEFRLVQTKEHQGRVGFAEGGNRIKCQKIRRNTK